MEKSVVCVVWKSMGLVQRKKMNRLLLAYFISMPSGELVIIQSSNQSVTSALGVPK